MIFGGQGGSKIKIELYPTLKSKNGIQHGTIKKNSRN